MTPWSALAAVIIAILAALPNILLYVHDRQRKFNLAVGVLTIVTTLALVSYVLYNYSALIKESWPFSD